MELNRRDFLKGSLAFGGVAALGGLAGCATPQQASNDSAKDAKPEKKSVPDSFTDGKWIGSAMGHDDDLFVQVTVAGGDIAGISVLRCEDVYKRQPEGRGQRPSDGLHPVSQVR